LALSQDVWPFATSVNSLFFFFRTYLVCLGSCYAGKEKKSRRRLVFGFDRWQSGTRIAFIFSRGNGNVLGSGALRLPPPFFLLFFLPRALDPLTPFFKLNLPQEIQSIPSNDSRDVLLAWEGKNVPDLPFSGFAGLAGGQQKTPPPKTQKVQNLK